MKAKASLDQVVELFYSFPDGSVFDSRKVGTRNFDGVFASYRGELDRMSKQFALFHNPVVRQQHAEGWRFRPDPQNEGEASGWQGADLADREWPRIASGKAWQQQGFVDHQGVAWYRKGFPAPAVKEGHRLLLYFDAIDGDAQVWLNGTLLGKHTLGEGGKGYNEPFYFDVTDVMRAGERQVVAMRVEKHVGIGGLTGVVSLIEADGIQDPVE